MIAAARHHRAHLSATARQDPAVRRAISAIADDAWRPIRYPHAVFDEQLHQWLSDAQTAEMPTHWPWADAWLRLFSAAFGPPQAAS